MPFTAAFSLSFKWQQSLKERYTYIILISSVFLHFVAAFLPKVQENS
jgi:hypothetical protein